MSLGGPGGGPQRRSGAPTRRSSGLLSSQARFDARAARVRRRPWLLAAWAFVALALLAGAGWLVEFSPVLVVKSVKVVGAPPGQVSAIVKRAAIPMGTPLVKIDTRAAGRRVLVLETLAKVTVSRSYPNTILIVATTRVPVLAVRNSQGQVQVVDSQGIAYATVKAAPKGVPLISSVESLSSLQSMRAALAVLGALSPTQRAQVTNVTVQGPNMVTFKLGAVLVMWGDASEPELKVKVMTDLLRQNNVTTIDVSAPWTPVIR